jgi:chemotaxis regulatin CheY-phosphate phosphatase CheZ
MDRLEEAEQMLAQRVGSLSPEDYEKCGPALQELGLAIAELREVRRDRVDALERLKQVLADLDRVAERVHDAVRLLDDAE